MKSPQDIVDNTDYIASRNDGNNRVLETLWRRKLIVLLGVILGGGAGYWYFLEAPKVYESSSIVLIRDHQPTQLLASDVKLMAMDKMETQLQLVTSLTVLANAAQDPALKKLAKGDSAASLASGVRASIVRQSQTMLVTYKSDDPTHATIALRAILKAYEEMLKSTYQNIGDDAAGLISEAVDLLNNKIITKRNEYAQFREENAAKITVVEGSIANIHSKRIEELLAQRSTLQNKAISLKTDLDLLRRVSQGGEPSASDTLVVLSKLNELSGGAMLREQAPRIGGVAQTEVELEELKGLLVLEKELSSKYGEDYPGIKDMRIKIDFLTELNARIANERKTSIESQLSKLQSGPALIQVPRNGRECLEMYEGVLVRELDRINAETETIEKEIAEEKTLSESLDKILVRDENLKQEIQQSESLCKQVMSRLDEVNIVKESGGAKAIPLNPPSNGIQIAPIMSQLIGIGSVVGLAIGFGIGFLMDLSEGTFRCPSDVVRSLNLQILGQVPSIESRRVKKLPHLSRLPATVIAAHCPSSSVAESFRVIRTALYFSSEGKGHQVLQVTSPTPGDGKSTLCANLAVSIAKSGKRILLIDADFRRPMQHKIFGVPNEIGLADYLANEGDLQPHTTDIHGLMVLPSGPVVSNPSELLSSSRMGKAIERFRENYDFVIIDTPPVLAVTDPLAIAARVDGVIVAMRIARGSQFSSKRTKEAIERVGGNILGVVINGYTKGSAFARGIGREYGWNYGAGYWDLDTEAGRLVTNSQKPETNRHDEDYHSHRKTTEDAAL